MVERNGATQPFFSIIEVLFVSCTSKARGTVEQTRRCVRKVYDKIKEIRAANPQPKDSFGAASLPEKSSIWPNHEQNFRNEQRKQTTGW